MGASQNKSDVTIQFLVGGLVIHFAGISVEKLFKNFMFVQWLNFFSILGGKYDPPKFLCKYSDPKRQFLEKICVD
jgi:hypothetical protein